MHITYLPWELILLILKQLCNYKDCLHLLITCKLFYDNKDLNKLIKNYFIEHIIHEDGTQIWFFNGRLHRENDKPAVIYPEEYQAWYFNGRRHREDDKPARIYGDGTQEWWTNGKNIK